MKDLTYHLAAHIVGGRATALSDRTFAAATRSLIDGVGVMLAATTMGQGCEPFAALAMEGGGGPATLLGRGAKAPMLLAALANGALAHAIDFEDAYDGAPVHPNASAIPAVIALAEAQGGVSGEDLLAALTIGCDLVCRMGLALDENPDRLGFYPPPLLGAFGAVAACGRIARLTERQMVDAWSLLLCSHNCSSQLKYSPDSDVRAVREAFAAHAALQAVLLARNGVSGFDAPLEGKAGFYALYAQGRYTPERLLDGLGTDLLGERLSYKQWPSCRGTHAFIEAALDLRATGVKVEDIRRIELRGDGFLEMLTVPDAQKRRPATPIDAKFSLPFTVAHALHHGEVTLDSFDPAYLIESAVLASADLVEFIACPDIGGVTAGMLTLVLADGSEAHRHVPAPLGSPENPLSDRQIEDKFRNCARRARRSHTSDQIESMLAALRSIRRAPDVGPILSSL